MDKEEKNEKLIKSLVRAGLSGKHGENSEEKFVEIWVRDEFKCVYCGEYLLKDKIRMTSAQIDHLLPKTKHPKYKDVPANWVLSCFLCNQLKRTFDPLKNMPEIMEKISPDTLGVYRNLLINACKEHLKKSWNEKEGILKKSLKAINQNPDR
jgi:hypothetical protein